MDELHTYRQEIDAIDEQLSTLLNQRMAVSRAVANYKAAHDNHVLDNQREQEVIDKAKARSDREDLKDYHETFFRQLMALSRAYQHSLINVENPINSENKEYSSTAQGVAYLGEQGSFSDKAAENYFGDKINRIPASSFRSIVEGVIQGTWLYGILPVENSLNGSIAQALDLFRDHRIFIIGEVVLPIRHCLLGLPGTNVDGIKKVISHPQALEQCSLYIDQNGFRREPRTSTASAAAELAKTDDRSIAAIGSPQLADCYPLIILKEDIQNPGNNFTRFAVIRSQPIYQQDTDKMSLFCRVPHVSGSLYQLLHCFAQHNLNLLNLTARPMENNPWHYDFYIDLEGGLHQSSVQSALKDVGRICETYKILGSYRHDQLS
ncbi:bifunctional chorismate mutase/prephenate dehydratase [Sporolactobacillus laevolacticus]|uniref:bifunctional chorismate mutase/prephenate dehydratase n=1 Tax=Sporolactobacillus laevolacticus TaxID=33018 RepID=UPI0025B2DB10|nr:bifunctional chorismate mutase/prephenate dehydratase [Sporolactobacillus laevolacticus]MDN3953565.1 bifunctional chorismate mutase/prephenate dehydratase [Sporolactobacillus laevolacticus]